MLQIKTSKHACSTDLFATHGPSGMLKGTLDIIFRSCKDLNISYLDATHTTTATLRVTNQRLGFSALMSPKERSFCFWTLLTIIFEDDELTLRAASKLKAAYYFSRRGDQNTHSRLISPQVNISPKNSSAQRLWILDLGF